MDTDLQCGFTITYADEIEDIGYRGVVKKIRDRVGSNPVYSEYGLGLDLCESHSFSSVSIDIDVVDPGMAPACVFFFNIYTLRFFILGLIRTGT